MISYYFDLKRNST